MIPCHIIMEWPNNTGYPLTYVTNILITDNQLPCGVVQ